MKKSFTFVLPKGSGHSVRCVGTKAFEALIGGWRTPEPNQGLFLLPLLNGRNRQQRQGSERIQLRDVTQYPSAAQRKEARYHGGRNSKSIFPNLQTRCCVRTCRTELIQSSKLGKVHRTNMPFSNTL